MSMKSLFWITSLSAVGLISIALLSTPEPVAADPKHEQHEIQSLKRELSAAKLEIGSVLIDSGVSSEAVIFTWEEFGFAATEMADYKSGAISSTHWVKERYYDAFNVAVGIAPPIGEIKYWKK